MEKSIRESFYFHVSQLKCFMDAYHLRRGELREGGDAVGTEETTVREVGEEGDSNHLCMSKCANVCKSVVLSVVPKAAYSRWRRELSKDLRGRDERIRGRGWKVGACVGGVQSVLIGNRTTRNKT